MLDENCQTAKVAASVRTADSQGGGARWRTSGAALLAAALLGAALLGVLGGAAPAHAEALRTTDDRGHVTDWSAGQLVARGLGVADRRAPSPAVARDAARRRAIADAVRQLIAGAAQLPLAGGQRLFDRLAKERLAELAAAEAVVLAAELLVDGSWRVEVALPLEALRQAAFAEPASASASASGARVLPAKGDASAAPAVVIVRAPAGTQPVLGLTISDGKTSVRAATLWASGSPAGVPLPERQLAAAPSLTASAAGSASGAELRVAKLAGASDATLFVVVLGQ